MEDNKAQQDKLVSTKMVCSIASMTALGVDGVDKMFMRLSDEVMDAIYPSAIAQGVKVTEMNVGYFIDLHLITRSNTVIPKICTEVQLKVKDAVEEITGKNVAQVNVMVMGSGKY